MESRANKKERPETPVIRIPASREKLYIQFSFLGVSTTLILELPTNIPHQMVVHRHKRSAVKPCVCIRHMILKRLKILNSERSEISQHGKTQTSQCLAGF